MRRYCGDWTDVSRQPAIVRRPGMSRGLRWLGLAGSLILIGNFWVLRAYGDTLQSTHLFIVRGTVFYPVAFLNLIGGVALLAAVVWGWVRKDSGVGK